MGSTASRPLSLDLADVAMLAQSPKAIEEDARHYAGGVLSGVV